MNEMTTMMVMWSVPTAVVDGASAKIADDRDDADPIEFPTQDGIRLDADGVGGDIAMSSCQQPFGFEAITGDCDDADPMTYPARKFVMVL